jgi:hypothetical protein
MGLAASLFLSGEGCPKGGVCYANQAFLDNNNRQQGLCFIISPVESFAQALCAFRVFAAKKPFFRFPNDRLARFFLFNKGFFVQTNETKKNKRKLLQINY